MRFSWSSRVLGAEERTSLALFMVEEDSIMEERQFRRLACLRRRIIWRVLALVRLMRDLALEELMVIMEDIMVDWRCSW